MLQGLLRLVLLQGSAFDGGGVAGRVFSAVGWVTFFGAAAGPSIGFLLALLTINVFSGGCFGGGCMLFEVFGVGGQNFMAAEIEAAHTCAKFA